jgi:hypothetical protein
MDRCHARGQAKALLGQPGDPARAAHRPIESVEIEAMFSKATQVMAWRELQDLSVWRQGWV